MSEEFIRAFFSRAVILQALRVALIVGPILLLVNHPELVLEQPFSLSTARQLALNLTVPYMVSSYSAARIAIRDGV